MKVANIVFWLACALLPALLVLVYLQHLVKLESYHFVPVLLISVVILFWSEWDKQVRLPSDLLSVSLVLGGVLFSGLGSWIGSPWLGCVAVLCVWAAFLNTQQSNDSRPQGLLPIIIPSTLLLRPPFQLDSQLTSALQSATSIFSSFILDSVGILHRLTGNIFFLEKGSLFVEDACSGVQSLFSLLFIAAFIVVWLKRPLILVPLYLLTGAAWALVMNIARVTTIALAQEWHNVDLAHGWQHQLLGYVCLLIAIGLLLSSDRLYQVLFFALPENEHSNKLENPFVTCWNRFALGAGSAHDKPGARQLFPTGLPFWITTAAVLMVMGLVSNALAYRSLDTVSVRSDTKIWVPAPDLLSNLSSDLRVIAQSTATRSEESALGKYSVLWDCEIASIPVRIAVSQYDEYHDLCQCYSASGWLIKDRETIVSIDNKYWRYVSAQFVNTESTFGTLLFSSMTRDGLAIDARDPGIWTSLRSRLGNSDDHASAKYDSESMNIQFWQTSDRHLTAEQLDKLKEIHELVRKKIQDSVRSGVDS